MNVSSSALPSYAKPPVNEVVLGIQSDKLTLASPLIGLLWSEFRASYPDYEARPALDSVVERFGDRPETVGPTPGLRLLEAPETPRCWFFRKDDGRLIQLQQDRFIYNWRRMADSDEYPHYEGVKAGFSAEYERLASFVRAEPKAGHLDVAWCEVTYVNHLLPARTVWHEGQLEKVFAILSLPKGGILSAMEAAQFRLAYVIPNDSGEPIGRLHISLSPAVRRSDGARMLVLDLTARGRPEGAGLAGVLQFMDRAHRWIVGGFTELTTPLMHTLWGRHDG